MEEQLKMLDAEETTPDSSLHKPESRREDKLPQDVSLVSPEEINLSLGPNLDTPRPTHLSTARSTASGSENIEQPSELKEDSVGAELIEACRRGDSDAIRKLMMDGADINVELVGDLIQLESQKIKVTCCVRMVRLLFELPVQPPIS